MPPELHFIESGSINTVSTQGICVDRTTLRLIPLMGKQQLYALRQRFPDEADARARLIEHKTSGSTGVAVRVLRSPAEERRLNMLHWRFHWMLGLRPGDRHARVRTTWEALSRRFNCLQDLSRSLRLPDVRIFDCFADPADSWCQLRGSNSGQGTGGSQS